MLQRHSPAWAASSNRPMKCKYTSLFSKFTAGRNVCIVSSYGARTQLGRCICRKGVSLHSCQGGAGWEKRKRTGLRQHLVCPILPQAGKHHGTQFPGKLQVNPCLSQGKVPAHKWGANLAQGASGAEGIGKVLCGKGRMLCCSEHPASSCNAHQPSRDGFSNEPLLLGREGTAHLCPPDRAPALGLLPTLGMVIIHHRGLKCAVLSSNTHIFDL